MTYVTSPTFESRIALVGGEVVRCPEFKVNEVFDSANGKDPLDQDPFYVSASRTLQEMLALHDDDRPDLIIYDFLAPAGRILAHRLKIPAVQTSPTFAHSRKNWPDQVTDPEFRRQILESSGVTDRFLTRHGVASDGFQFFREKLNIYLFPKELQPAGDDLGESCFFAGRCAGEQPYYGDWQRSAAIDRPIVFVATSTTYLQKSDFFQMCIAALSGLRCHVILSIGDHGDAAGLKPLPPHCEIVQHTSHIKILPHVSAFICLGGIITTSEALYHGVPLIVTSLGALELEWQAENLERLGIAIHIRKSEMTAEKVRAATARALEDRQMRNRVRDLRDLVRRAPGGEETANRIEEHLETWRILPAGDQMPGRA